MPPSSFPNEPQPSQAAPFFVNMHDSNQLDDSSRTQVRVQVMKDYHRRRSQKQDKPRGPKPVHPPSAKAQTLKFRLGADEPLKAWAPVKSGSRSKGVTSIRKRKTTRQEEIEEQQKLLSIAPIPLFVDIGNTREVPFDGQDDQEDTNDHNSSLLNLDSFIASPTLSYIPASNVVDPFDSTALTITPRIQLLLYHYFKVNLQSSWLMMPMRKTLYSVAITDRAMFHSFIAHYAASYNTRFKIKDSIESVQHTAIAASLINERLSDPALALSDSTIATVANLCAYESSNGSKSSMIVHMNGLDRMVRLRGGLQEGGFSLIVQRMIAWADFHVATALLQNPRFPPLDIGLEAEPHLHSPDSANHSEALRGRSKGERPPLMELLSGVESLGSTLRLLRRKTIMPQEDIWYSDKIYFLQRNLFDIAHGQLEDASLDIKERELDRLCALAALMYCGYCLRNIPFSFASFVNGVSRLKPAIELFQTNFAFSGYDSCEVFQMKKFFWVLAFGACAAEGKPEREWFVGQVRVLRAQMGIVGWESAKELLGSVLWQPELDAFGTVLWAEVEATNLEPVVGSEHIVK